MNCLYLSGLGDYRQSFGKKCILMFIASLLVPAVPALSNKAQGEHKTHTEKLAEAVKKNASFDLSGPVKPWTKYQILPAGQIRPTGWIATQMKLDLQKGITGNYDKISDTVAKNLFVTNKSETKNEKTTDLGLRSWWSGEHEGYWKDSVIRMAFLTGLEPYQNKARKWMKDIVDSQEEDGYIGIYPKGERFTTDKVNGELWTQSRMFAAMLAYYEYTNDASVLKAVERATQLTMSKYNKTYFSLANDDGGVSHAVGFFDILEWLYRITGNRKYADYAIFLYNDFNENPPRDDDLTYKNLMHPTRPFVKHGPHIAEGFHMPFLIATYTGDEKYKIAAKNALTKLRYHLTPGGGMVSYEYVYGEAGIGTTKCEYCCAGEFNVSLVRAIQFSGDMSIADIIEKMTFNAAQGARLHPVNRAALYISEDDRNEIGNIARNK